LIKQVVENKIYHGDRRTKPQRAQSAQRKRREKLNRKDAKEERKGRKEKRVLLAVFAVNFLSQYASFIRAPPCLRGEPFYRDGGKH
jgi:hypothetical protein